MKHRIFLPLAAAIVVSIAGCSGSTDTTEEKQDTPIPVVTAKPSQTTMNGVTASGQVEALSSASISTRLIGTITHVYVKVGDRVRQGQLLATISSEEITAKKAQTDAQITGAQAELENAKKDFDRYNALFARQSATASELDNATLRFHAAKSRLETARQMRREIDASAAYARLTAPFSGAVTQRLMDEGNLATPGTPILVLEQDHGLRVSATVPESDINRIKTGDKAVVEVKSTGLKITGALSQISASSIATGGQYQVRISLPEAGQKGLYSGMYVNVFIPVNAQPASAHPDESQPASAAKSATENEPLLVPKSALVEKDQLTGLYTISSQHTALLRYVRTGRSIGDKIEILSGLNAGESFIVSSSGRLYNGTPVTDR
ncbi:MAG: efflux RND transporter periplasmic adaptor subunit [Bacteroidetes bacterium]|nr:efflux RND transporter periplasmic adaptor subunit [Bacteroidota bacterium]